MLFLCIMMLLLALTIGIMAFDHINRLPFDQVTTNDIERLNSSITVQSCEERFNVLKDIFQDKAVYTNNIRIPMADNSHYQK